MTGFRRSRSKPNSDSKKSCNSLEHRNSDSIATSDPNLLKVPPSPTRHLGSSHQREMVFIPTDDLKRLDVRLVREEDGVYVDEIEKKDK